MVAHSGPSNHLLFTLTCGCTSGAVVVQSSCKRTTRVRTPRSGTEALSSPSFLCRFSWTASAGLGICARVTLNKYHLPFDALGIL